ncbi:hypothetical protein B0H13DRAFT_1883593 [Mycena leptocephala]|nr:hypothetical protein B0H13DRAFT_1883593 [Mycena leptocephala]
MRASSSLIGGVTRGVKGRQLAALASLSPCPLEKTPLSPGDDLVSIHSSSDESGTDEPPPIPKNPPSSPITVDLTNILPSSQASIARTGTYVQLIGAHAVRSHSWNVFFLYFLEARLLPFHLINSPVYEPNLKYHFQMRLPFPSWRGKPPFSTAKLKVLRSRMRASAVSDVPDLLSTTLLALKESADAFPPLKSAVGGVLAVCNIAQRAKHAKSDARDVALRTQAILDVIADAVPDASAISAPMLQSIERFTVLLDEISCLMEEVALSSGISRVVHLNRNGRTLQDIKARLDDAYRDFLAASALRVEAQHTQTQTVVQQIQVQQTQLAGQHAQIHIDVGKVAASTDTLAHDVSSVLFFFRIVVFFGLPLKPNGHSPAKPVGGNEPGGPYPALHPTIVA